MKKWPKCSKDFWQALYLVSQKSVCVWRGLLNRSIWPIFKTKLLIFRSKATLDQKFSLVKSIFKAEQLEKCLQEVFMGIENPTLHSGP